MEGIRTVNIIEDKKNKIPHKTLEGIRAAKMLNIFNIYSINNIKNKKIIFFLCIYKMVNITKEMYKSNGIEIITDNLNTLWLNEKHVEQQLEHKNLREATNKYNKEYRKRKYELIDEPIKQSHRRFIRSDLALKIIMDYRPDESCNLKGKLGLRLHNVINTKEQTVINSIKDAFERENMQTQYNVLGYRIDLYFHEYNLATEVDELGHNDRNIDYEIQRQQALERELNCVFIRINPDAVDFNIFKEINKIQRHTEKSSKKSLIDKISKRLLEIEFASDHLIKSKYLKWIVKKYSLHYKK